MTASPDTERYTINEWGKIKGIKVLDPDGFDRRNPDLMETLFTEREFEEGALGSTIEYKKPVPISPTENTEELRTRIWELLDDHFDTSLLTDDDADSIDEAIEAYADQAVQAFGEKVLKEATEYEVTDLELLEHHGETPLKAVSVSVITSLMKGGV